MAIGSILGGIGGTLVSHALNQRSQKKAFQQNVDFWRMKFDQTNKYNNPVQQVARLKDAGLNPALLYGQSASGVSGEAKSQSSEGMKASQVQFNPQMVLMSAQAEQLKNDAELKRQDAALRRVQATHEMTKNAKTDAERRTAESLANTSRDLYKAELESAQVKSILGGLELYKQKEINPHEIQAVISDARYKAANAKSQEYQNELYEETRKKLVQMGIDPRLALQLLSILK